MSTRPRLPDLAGAACGLAAGGVALAIGQVNARLVDDGVPPLRAMGDLVIRETPVGVTNAIIDAVGTHDKALLRGCVLVVAVALAGLVGVAYVRGRQSWALLGVALLALAPVLAVASAPTGSAVTELLVVMPAAVIGGATLAVLAHPVARLRVEQSEPAAVSRRQLLRAGAVVVLAGAIGQAAFRALSEPPKALTQRLKNALPLPPRPLAPLVDELAADGATPLITPAGEHYRIDTALELPLVDPDTWTLSLSRDGQPVATFTYDDLLARATTEADITIGCIGNEVGGALIGTARWQGVLLSDLLAPAGVSGTGRVAALSVDGFLASFPLEAARRTPGDAGRRHERASAARRARLPGPPGRARPLRVHLGGQVAVGPRRVGPDRAARLLGRPRLDAGRDRPRDEPHRHPPLRRHPARWCAAPRRHRLGTHGGRRRGRGPGRRRALAAGTALHPGQRQPVAAVVLDWEAEPGRRRLRVRATDASGTVQDSEERDAYPSGATGLHSVTVRVG